MLKDKTILVGITGGIAAYKIYDLIRLYKKNGASVKVLLTQNALEFVNRLTLETLSCNPVCVNQFDAKTHDPQHISLAKEADIFVIAPASANTIGKMACGICDNLLTSIACAFTKEIILAPAMNTGMWENQAVQRNIKKLEQTGCEIIQPASGFLACGDNGAGRLPQNSVIFDKTVELLNKEGLLKDKTFLITAGGTRENIDAVRYVSNRSSGKMGLAFADTAYKMGAKVILISTFDVEKPYQQVKVDTALEMREKVLEFLPSVSDVVMVAAVADYRPKEAVKNKIKKDSESLTVEFVKNPDILSEICGKKTENQTIIGFCAETDDLITNAKNKILKKKCDYIVANDVSRLDTGFCGDDNEVLVIDKSLSVKKIEKNSKKNIAKKVLEFIYGKSE